MKEISIKGKALRYSFELFCQPCQSPDIPWPCPHFQNSSSHLRGPLVARDDVALLQREVGPGHERLDVLLHLGERGGRDFSGGVLIPHR